jgi:hypothetical protein
VPLHNNNIEPLKARQEQVDCAPVRRVVPNPRAIHEAGARRHEPALASIQQQKLATDREAVTLSFAS